MPTVYPKYRESAFIVNPMHTQSIPNVCKGIQKFTQSIPIVYLYNLPIVYL